MDVTGAVSLLGDATTGAVAVGAAVLTCLGTIFAYKIVRRAFG